MKKILCIITCILMTAALCGGCSDNVQEQHKIDMQTLYDLIGESEEATLEALGLTQDDLTLLSSPSEGHSYLTPLCVDYAGGSFDVMLSFDSNDGHFWSFWYTAEVQPDEPSAARIVSTAKKLIADFGEPESAPQKSHGGVHSIDDANVSELYEEIIHGRYVGGYFWLIGDQVSPKLQQYLDSQAANNPLDFGLTYEWTWNEATKTATIYIKQAVRPA